MVTYHVPSTLFPQTPCFRLFLGFPRICFFTRGVDGNKLLQTDAHAHSSNTVDILDWLLRPGGELVGGFDGRVVAFLVGLMAFVSLCIGCCGCPELRDMGCLVVWRLLCLEVATARTLGCYTGRC